MENTAYPSTSLIDYRYEQIDKILNSLYTQRIIYPGEFLKLFAIAHYLDTLSSFFPIVIYEKKMGIGRTDALPNLPQVEKLQQEIDALQKLLQHNESVYREVDFFIHKLFLTIPAITETMQ